MTETTPEAPAGGRLTGGIAALMSSNVIGALLAFALTVLIGRLAGENGLGVYAASLAWVFPLALLVDAGVGTLISRDLAYPNAPPSRAYLRAALFLRLALGIPVAVGLITAAPLLAGSPEAAEGMRISAGVVVLMPMVSAFTAVYRARRRMRPAAFLNIGTLLVQLVLTTVAFAAGWGVMGALWINLIATAGQFAAAYLIWRTQFAEPIGSGGVEPVVMLRRAFPFAVAAVIAAAQMRLNVIVLERAVSPAEAGAYAAAARLIEAGRLIPQAVFDAMLPFLTMMAAQPAVFARTFGMARRGLVAYGLVFGVLVWLLAYALIGLFFGAAFDSSAEVLRVLAWSLLPMSLKYLRGLYWYALKHERWVNTVAVFALGGQLLAAVLILPAYGVLGAAWVALISETIAAAVLWFAKPLQSPQ